MNASVLVCLLITLATSSLNAADHPPQWAYGTTDASASSSPQPKPMPSNSVPDQSSSHLPGSNSAFTRAEIGNPFGPADWYPKDHPEMPAIVAHGRKPGIWACALCHYPNGKGRPENAGVSGLPVSYFIQQMNDFKNGLRKSADPGKKNTNLMITYAKEMTDAEIKEAAEYFGSMKWSPWIKVVETTSVPKTRLSVGMFLPIENGGHEPIGERIIETPVNADATEVLRDPRSSFVAYVPVGSLKRGEALVTKGAGKTVSCSICHGADLRGIGPVPGIAGRSPSYVTRQLYDMQHDFRRGEWTSMMKTVVANLTEDDMLNIAAYTASLPPI